MAGEPSGVRLLARALGLAVSIGVPFGVLVSSGALGGMYLDKRWNTTPWLTVAGVVLGAVAAFINLVRVASRFGSGRSPDGQSS